MNDCVLEDKPAHSTYSHCVVRFQVCESTGIQKRDEIEKRVFARSRLYAEQFQTLVSAIMSASFSTLSYLSDTKGRLEDAVGESSTYFLAFL
jgi:hypothetical protein